MSKPETAVFALGESGAETARRVAAATEGKVFEREFGGHASDTAGTEFGSRLRAAYESGLPVVGVCAAGILIRSLAPVLRTKTEEPPLVCVAEDGSTVVPLLGGHRGANRLAKTIADALSCEAVVTTAGDLAFGVALDDPPDGWRLETPASVKRASAAMLAGASVSVSGGGEWLAPLVEAIGADWRRAPGADAPAVIQVDGVEPLVYRRAGFALGVGCSRNCPHEELAGLAMRTLAEAGISPFAVEGVYSIEHKSDEAAVHALARSLGVPARFYSVGQLRAETGRLETPSEQVFREVGSRGVCEAAALARAGPDGKLESPKRKSAAATCAIARIGSTPGTVPSPRGLLAVVGLGPGKAEWRTAEATRLIWQSDLLVGYGKYLDLLGKEFDSIPARRFDLGDETTRCRHALEQAAEGKRVALVCSGDCGVYAMASLVMELASCPENADLPEHVRRVEIVCAPGVSAMQAASARAGALLGHDFCAISLSDLLTPEEEILKRVEAAAAGDFVTAFYNPSSSRRTRLLSAARDILLRHRPSETPVLIARNLGREDESLSICTLSELDESRTDMLTTVLVGSSRSETFRTGDSDAGAGGWLAFTPRGYASRTGSSERR